MKIIVLLISAVAGICTARAQERPFAHTFSTNIIHPGDVTVELLHTSRFGHAEGEFHAMDQYLEFEVGVSHRLQAAFSLTRFQEDEAHDDAAIQDQAEVGINTEWKWRINHPDKKTGLGFFGGVGYHGSLVNLEYRLILDRSQGKHLWAFNMGSELELQTKKEEEEHKKLPLELDLAYMYHFSHKFGAGIEILDCNDLSNGHWNNSILYAGPTLNYHKEHWFVVANFLPQLVNLHRTTAYPSKKVLTDHERMEVRIILGFSF